MKREEILQKKRDIAERCGPWTSHNYLIADGHYAVDGLVGPDYRLRRIVQIVRDLSARPLRDLRILDLACLEGGFGLELTLHGAQVLGIEGREANLEKARFAREIYQADRLELVLDDVRHLSRDKYGGFDAVLCMGILYHLDAPDLFHFMQRVAEVCDRLAIVDTHISTQDTEKVEWAGHAYWGIRSREHDDEATPEDKLRANLDSLDNVRSFWLTHPSLCNLLRHVGFTSVYQCFNPYEITYPDYVTLVAVKGEPAKLATSPITNECPEEDWSEDPQKNVFQESADWQWPGKPAGWNAEKDDSLEMAADAGHDGHSAEQGSALEDQLAELQARYSDLAAEHSKLQERYLPLTTFTGALRHLSGTALQALRRRLRGHDRTNG